MITLAATPIGNSEDATLHLIDLLKTADIVAAEDTRRLLALCSRLEIKISGKLISNNEQNERKNAEYLLSESLQGKSVVVVTDAGMPIISDPGFSVVQYAIEQGEAEEVAVAPGACAVVTALALSGLPSEKFIFEGFMPRKSGQRINALEALKSEKRTVIFYESTHRINKTIRVAAEVLDPNHRVVLARELTKTHQEIIRCSISELNEIANDEAKGRDFKGEIVLLFSSR